MGSCCQKTPKEGYQEVNLQPTGGTGGGGNMSSLENEVLQDLIDAYIHNERYFTMIIDKLDLDLDLMINKYHSEEAILFFQRKVLFEEFLKIIEKNLNILNNEMKSNKKVKAVKNFDEMKDLLDEMQSCSEINFNFNEWKNLEDEQKKQIQQEFQILIEKHLKGKSTEIESRFRKFEKDTQAKKNESPLSKKH